MYGTAAGVGVAVLLGLLVAVWLRAYSKSIDSAPPPKQIDATAVSTTSRENPVLNASVGVNLEVAPPVAGASSAVQSASASDPEVEMNAASAGTLHLGEDSSEFHL